MDKLVNDFVVNRPIEQTWTVLTDVERIAPCLPGAQLEEIEGDTYRGVVKVKLGAIATAFRGQANFVERDDVNHKAVLHGEGRDTTGKGNADAMITATLEAVSDTETKVTVETDLRVTGKVAQFGRGIMGDVSKKLMAQFANNLNTMLDQEGNQAASSEPEPAAAVTDEAVTDEAVTDAPAAAASNGSTGSTPTVRKIDGPASEPIELSGLAGTAVLKRLLPALGGLVLLILVLRRFGRR
ncbi:MAG: putative carbon monoxide dehydrogenase accessory protein [Ilumatobacteraceae bacterium]|nr:putative carbon monoxide dehydrogenase accessory protein [Ilumatobacteraceae bacterium]